MADGSTSEPPDPVSAVLTDLWTKRRPEVVADLSALRSLLEILMRAPDDRVERTRATAIAHRLHGALGVFGFAEVKAHIAEIEAGLRDESAVTSSTVAALEAVIRELPR